MCGTRQFNKRNSLVLLEANNDDMTAVNDAAKAVAEASSSLYVEDSTTTTDSTESKAIATSPVTLLSICDASTATSTVTSITPPSSAYSLDLDANGSHDLDEIAGSFAPLPVVSATIVAPEEILSEKAPTKSTGRSTHKARKAVSKKKRKPHRLSPGLTAKGGQRQFIKHVYTDRSQEKDIYQDIEDQFLNKYELFPRRSSSSGASAPETEDVPSPISSSSIVGGSKLTPPFPVKLHMILKDVEDQGLDRIISWLPHGRAFIIRDSKQFASEVVSRYFRQSKITSFNRQLNLYGFGRITNGKDNGAYYHEYFLRNRASLARNICRTKVKGTKIRAASNPEEEPDFYSMSSIMPETRADDFVDFEEGRNDYQDETFLDNHISSITTSFSGEEALTPDNIHSSVQNNDMDLMNNGEDEALTLSPTSATSEPNSVTVTASSFPRHRLVSDLSLHSAFMSHNRQSQNKAPSNNNSSEFTPMDYLPSSDNKNSMFSSRLEENHPNSTGVVELLHSSSHHGHQHVFSSDNNYPQMIHIDYDYPNQSHTAANVVSQQQQPSSIPPQTALPGHLISPAMPMNTSQVMDYASDPILDEIVHLLPATQVRNLSSSEAMMGMNENLSLNKVKEADPIIDIIQYYNAQLRGVGSGDGAQIGGFVDNVAKADDYEEDMKALMDFL